MSSSAEPDSARMNPSVESTLALVSAALGFAGAVFLASLWLSAATHPLPAILLVICTTIMAALCGRQGARRLSTPVGFAAGIILAGGANGLVLATMAAMTTGDVSGFAMMLAGTAFGMICALPFVPALVVAFIATRRLGRARRGSLLDEADRRAPWTAVCITILAGGLGLSFVWPEAYAPPVLAVLAAAAIGSLVLAVLTVRSWRRARGWQHAFATAQPSDGMTAEVPEGAIDHDLGVGDEARELRRRGDAYRTGVRTTARLRGDSDRAGRILRLDLALGALSLALSLATIACLPSLLADCPGGGVGCEDDFRCFG